MLETQTSQAEVFTVSPNEVGSIDVNATSSNVQIVSSDKDVISIQWKDGNVVLEGDKLILDSKAGNSSAGRTGDNLLIEIPTNHRLYEIQVVTSSGDLELNGIDLNKFSFSAFINGNASISNTNLDNLEINLIVGNVSFNNVAFESGDINTASGDINFRNTNFNNGTINTVAGDIKFNGVDFGLANINSAAGDIEMDRVNFESADMNNASGDIEIENTNFTSAMMNTATGDIDLKGIIFNELQLNTFSGEMSVRTELESFAVTSSNTNTHMNTACGINNGHNNNSLHFNSSLGRRIRINGKRFS